MPAAAAALLPEKWVPLPCLAGYAPALFQTKKKKMGYDNYNSISAGSSFSSSLGSNGPLEPFVKAGIASVISEGLCRYVPHGTAWLQASLGSELNSKALNQRFKFLRSTTPQRVFENCIAFGSLEILRIKATATNDGVAPNFYQEVGCGLLAAVIKDCVTNPYATAKRLVMLDSYLPVEKRVNYQNVFDAIYRIVTREGISALWTREASLRIPYILSRAAVFASYHRSINYFEDLFGSDGDRAGLAAGAVSGLFHAAICIPTTNVDRRIRIMKPNSEDIHTQVTWTVDAAEITTKKIRTLRNNPIEQINKD